MAVFEAVGADEVEIVRRCVVLGVRPTRGPRQTAHGEVEHRRTELALIVAIGIEVEDLGRLAGVFQNVRSRSIYFRISTSAPLVSDPTRVTQTGQHHTVSDIGNLVLVPGKPCDCAYGPWYEKEPIGKPMRRRADLFCHRYGEAD